MPRKKNWRKGLARKGQKIVSVRTELLDGGAADAMGDVEGIGSPHSDHDDSMNKNCLHILSENQVDSLNKNRLDILSQNQVDSLNKNRLDILSQNQVDSLNKNRLDILSQNQVDSLNKNRLGFVLNLPPEAYQENSLNTNQVDSLNKNRLDTLSENQGDSLNKTCQNENLPRANKIKYDLNLPRAKKIKYDLNLPRAKKNEHELNLPKAKKNPVVQIPKSSSVNNNLEKNDQEIGMVRNIIQGTYHQGDPRFLNNSGRQCVSNSLAAICYSRIKDINTWLSFDLDTVLDYGNELYGHLQNSSTMRERYLLVTELPDRIELFNTIMQITLGESLAGLLYNNQDTTPEIAMSIENALRRSFVDHFASFITYSGMTFAVLKSSDHYYIFDSHSRSDTGIQVPNGESVLIGVTSLAEVVQHCFQLARSMNVRNDTQFEITGVSIVVDECLSEEITETIEHDDVIIVGEAISETFQFKPLTSEVQKELCSKMLIKHECGSAIKHQSEIGQPHDCHQIVADGNCFFRALSYAVSGTEKYHRKLRLATVNHLKGNSSIFKTHLRAEYNSVHDYLEISRMWYVKTWATELEILAAAHMLQTDIYVFQYTWLRFSAQQVSKTSSPRSQAIYLKHCDQTHYEVVLTVQRLPFHTLGNDQVLKINEKSTCESCDVHIEAANLTSKTTQNYSETLKSKKRKLRLDSYSQNEALRKIKKQRVAARYHSERAYRDKQKGISTHKYETDSIHKSNKKANSILKYKTNETHTQAVKSQSQFKYKTNEAHRHAVRSRSTLKYKTNEGHKHAVRAQSTLKYKTNEGHKHAVRAQSTLKYKTNEAHKHAVRAQSTLKYKTNETHKQAIKEHSKLKYKTDEAHRHSVKAYSKLKYKTDEAHRRKVNTTSDLRYKTNIDHRNVVKEQNLVRKHVRELTNKIMDRIIAKFKETVSDGPEYVCCVCHRLLFQDQVIKCNRETYSKKGNAVRQLAEKCISANLSEEYAGSCSDLCSDETKLWVCHTCHRKMISNTMPAEAVVNNMKVPSVPPELDCLNSLEQHLIAKHIPFMKLLSLPKGGQRGVHGPVVCISSNISKTTNCLPRCENDDQMIRVKLKRKLSYKGHYEYQFVSRSNLETALNYLRQHNKWYGDVIFNEDWENTLSEDDAKNDLSVSENEIDDLQDLAENEADEEEGRRAGMLLDTCLQPVDPGQEILDQHFEKIFCIAPGEGQKPVNTLMDEGNEAKSFPVLFPTGLGTFHDKRDKTISLAKYLHHRLMNVDNRFAKCIDYIFYAQYQSELQQVLSNVSIALRKGSGIAKSITSKSLTEKEPLKEILKKDEGYKFLKPIRGTPPFWQAAKKDLFAMIRQLGIPTWFCSFSAADMRWNELVQTILKQQCDGRQVSELDWSDKCKILRSNPVTVARMFDRRFQKFLKKVIMSPAEPIGKIKDYFYRVEFQQRGSPHTHCLFWVDNAPNVETDDDAVVTEFIDKYITCELPSVENQEELHEIVSNVQKHSYRHSKSCKKTGKKCRFNFPRPPSANTFICHPDETCSSRASKTDGCDIDNETSHERMTPAIAEGILKKFWNALVDENKQYRSLEDIFFDLGICQKTFQEACSKVTNKSYVVLQRRLQDVWINQYNADLLKCWNANMDIQYVFDAYSCVMYIVSYISKSEREMGLLLDHAQREAKQDGNMDAKAAMKQIGHAYLHNREVSAQESVYRVCNLKLKGASRKVQFIPIGDNPVKLSLPLKVLQRKAKDTDLNDENIWMSSIVDKYKARPSTTLFDNMCLACFCSEYRVLSESEINRSNRSKVYELQNALGFIMKRSRTEPAVIRYVHFSQTKTPEKYYQSILQLFLPHHLDVQLKPISYERYEDFYQSGAVKMDSNITFVRKIVDTNMSLFEKEGHSLDAAQKQLEMYGPLEDAWALICPELESERIECQDTTIEVNDMPTESTDIPGLLPAEKRKCSEESHQSVISRSEAEPLLRSLNNEQSSIFYKIRQWCLDKVHGKNPEPFHVFVTGGAGTGKSHLIKCIYYEATQIFQHSMSNPDDVSILMTAPTGVAAFNIGARTIHSSLSIRIDSKLPYQPLGEETMNTLRSKLGSLEILVIDEISMVDHKLLCYVHGRLRQIKQTGEYSPFGNVSILAVGDFYQLPPVKGKALYTDSEVVNLWQPLFSIAELQHIMRQREDLEFAETLNRLRTRTRSQPIDAKDVKLLSNCETGVESDSMHIYATNAQVDNYNQNSLFRKCSNPVLIKAKDFTRNGTTGKMEKCETPHVRLFNTTLQSSITLAEGARIMLTKNIDVSDGLVNGVFGTVAHIRMLPDALFPTTVYVVFDNERVGRKVRSETPSPSTLSEDCTPIVAQEDVVSNAGCIRKQFPMKLAWACTIHKVQGLTIDKAVVSLDHIFAPGQAYVALSRVKTLRGLTIQDFKERAIYANENVKDSLVSMPQFVKPTENGKFDVILHNIQGLRAHHQDLINDPRITAASFICLTETWLIENGQCDQFSIRNFILTNRSRQACYNDSVSICKELKQQAHGGVGIYSATDRASKLLSLNIANLEHMALYVPDVNITVVVIYRPSSCSTDLFLAQLQILLQEMEKLSGGKIVMGDFNQNILHETSSILNFMTNRGYSQRVNKATTTGDTLLDHVYTTGFDDNDSISVSVIPTYYSYHEAVHTRTCPNCRGKNPHVLSVVATVTEQFELTRLPT